MSNGLPELRFAVRGLVRAPGFSIVAIMTLAVGIGANAAVFSIVSGTLLNPLPWRDPGAVVELTERNLRQSEQHRVPTARYLEYRAQAASLDDLAAVRESGFNLTDDASLESVEAAYVTPNSFPLLGIRLHLGRGFIPADAVPGADRVVVLGRGLWSRRYGRDPDIVGRTIELDGEPATVVGVLADDQWFPWPWTQMTAPLRLDPGRLSRTDHELTVFGRLGPGVSLERAQTELDVISARLAAQYPETDADWSAGVSLARDRFVQGRARTGVWIMMGAVGFVLLIACANLANLLLARATARNKEISIRAALGAGRGHIVLQLLTESGVLAAAALPLALVVTRWALDFFLAQVHPSETYVDQLFRLDAPVLAFACVCALSTVLLFGLVPALQVSRPDLSLGLKEGERGSSDARGQRLRHALVVGQIGLALSLLVGSGLMIQSFLKMQTADPGFDIGDLLVTTLTLPDTRYPEAEHWRRVQVDLLARLDRIPGVEGAATVNHAPFGFGGDSVDFRVRGRERTPGDELPRAMWANPSPGYLSLLGVGLGQGRHLETTDRPSGARVVVVNETLARRYFPAQSPLGEHLVVARAEGEQIYEIVGVARDLKNWRISEDGYPRIYAPFAQAPSASMSLVVRFRGDSQAAAYAVRSEVTGIDPQLPVFSFETMTSRYERSMWTSSLFIKVMTILSGVALLLAAVGVYGIVSYATTRRTREFGIRSALGAAPAHVARLVLREALVLAGLGVALGLVLAAGLSRVIESLLYEVDRWSPPTFAGFALMLVAVALAAGVVPARRATRVDPMVALRAE